MAKPGKPRLPGEPGGGGGEDKGDIRLALKMPGRGSLQNRQVSNAFKKVRQALRSSSGGAGKRGLSTRQRGAGVAPVSGKAGGHAAAAAAAKPLQRVSVRWTYSKNKGDGQWGAHGKYIERESAQEQELEQVKDLEQLPEQERQAEGPDKSTTPEKETQHERTDRYTDPDALRSPGRLAALRESYLGEIGRTPAAKSLNGVRSLSGVGVVRWQGRGEVLLPGDAPHHLVERGTQRDDGLRRGSDGESRKAPRSGPVKRGVVGFGSEGDAMRISETLDRWQKGGDEHMFKLIVSPEFGDKMDLKKHVKELVQQMEKDLGTKLQWVAIDHYNTDNPHVHVAVRGVDDRGQKLEVSPAYIKEGSRVRAQEAATRQLGYRSDRDVAEALERQVTQQRFTEIDRGLLKKAVNQEVSFDGELPSGEKARDTRVRQIRRLAQLEAMGLAERTGNKSWRLNPALESALRQMQVSQDRLKTKFAHREMISDPSAPLVATELKTLGQRVAGKVVGTGMNEATNRPYLLVEGFDGKVHYLNQSPKVQKMRGEGELKAGDFVALEVVQRKDKDGKVAGDMVRVERYGRTMTPELLDRELMRKGRAVDPITAKQSVAGAFLDAAAARLKRLQDAGAVEVSAGQVREKSPVAHDRVRFEDAGIRAADYTQGAALAKVLQKGRASVAFEAAGGQRLVVTGAQLEAMGLDQKFVAKDATVFLGVDSKGKPMASVVKVDQLPDLIRDPRTNKLDLMAQQLGQLPASHPLASAIRQRAETWKQRGVNLQAEDFGKDAAVWRKNMELAESSDLGNVVSARQLNRLDWMLQQAYQPTTAPLEKALQQRAEVWKQRGVDPMDPKFALKANTWRKSVELHEAAAAKGVDKVLEELSREKGKPVRELECAPGRQVSGRVVLVQKEADQSSVVVDSGRELTLLRQPSPSEADLKAGQRVRARAEEVVEKNTQRRMMMWRFADLEREQARQKGQERKMF